MWADPWWWLGWLTLAACGGCLGLVLLLVVWVFAVAAGHTLAVRRDTLLWDLERPRVSAWRKLAAGSSVTVTLERGLLTARVVPLVGGAATQLNADAVVPWLRINGYRLAPGSKWEATRG